MIKVPFNPEAGSDQSFQILLSEKEIVNVRVTWSERQQCWHMSLDMSKKMWCMRLVDNYPLMFSHKYESPINGDFIVWPLVSNPSPVSYGNLGSEWGIIYLTQSEVDNWKKHNGIG